MLNIKKALTELAKYITTEIGSITLDSKYKGSIHTSTRITKQGDVVNVYIRLQPITIPAGNNQLIATIDQADLRPCQVVYDTVQIGNNLYPASINASGKLVLNIPTAVTDGYVMFNTSYNVKR